MSNKDIYILGIESSCDDTSAAILKNDKVLSNVIANQDIHKNSGGVVPELASRAHLSNIIPTVESAIKEAKISLDQLSAISFTKGPGLMGSLIVGTEFSKALGISLKIPVIEVNHMQAHILVHFINNGNIKPSFPFLGVTISGGHTQFILVKNYFEMEILGETLDDAIGEAFDKCGKKLGLGYPAGPLIDKLAKKGDEDKFKFPLPKVKGGNISYSGTKTAFINFLHKNKTKNIEFINQNINDICASIQKNLIDKLSYQHVHNMQPSIPKLEEVLSSVGHKTNINIEIKNQGIKSLIVVEQVICLLKEFNLIDNISVTLSS